MSKRPMVAVALLVALAAVAFPCVARADPPALDELKPVAHWYNPPHLEPYPLDIPDEEHPSNGTP